MVFGYDNINKHVTGLECSCGVSTFDWFVGWLVVGECNGGGGGWGGSHTHNNRTITTCPPKHTFVSYIAYVSFWLLCILCCTYTNEGHYDWQLHTHTHAGSLKDDWSALGHNFNISSQISTIDTIDYKASLFMYLYEYIFMYFSCCRASCVFP